MGLLSDGLCLGGPLLVSLPKALLQPSCRTTADLPNHCLLSCLRVAFKAPHLRFMLHLLPPVNLCASSVGCSLPLTLPALRWHSCVLSPWIGSFLKNKAL